MKVQTVDVAPYRELIRRQHLSQSMVALKTGVSQATVHEIMAGRFGRVSTSTALRLIKGLEGNIVIHQRGEEL